MLKFDWLCGISVDTISEFLTIQNFDFISIEKRFNAAYGTYFVVYSDKINGGVLYLGNYGKLKQKNLDGKIAFEDDFEYAKSNLAGLIEYIALIHKENKVNNVPVRKHKKTYIEDFKNKFNSYLEKEKQKGEE